ncbi:(2Fe-2S) ferredoxin domain-containing protein [Calothrix sp. UHCC 0171]|uniref:(2Fe-2S) ferredoxin domain-containing protein n=1 Tax=Calothrix sp. UHCC 0171 TaxID=3110245 RepID=UPI002B1F319E|nr:(2Fe-2S) ferredoxin domain-containing protein [Calothrix sp. UHCC 0171]MEA5569935.1 (2Fe-2S) ferredoxin domain-containing protein [Calothrix sp. UHCC 0171]
MNKYQSTEITQFCLEGRFLEFVIKDGYKLKGLMIMTSEGEYYVKLAKHLRFAFDLRLPPGTVLQILGTKKYCTETGRVKLKADRIMAATGEREIHPTSVAQAVMVRESDNPKPEKKAVILMCQKSDCMKRGGKALCQALENELGDRNLDNVSIKPTGCMKNCKGAPNLVMPDKTRYSRIQAQDVPALLDKHFPKVTPHRQPTEQLQEGNIVVPVVC